MSKRIRGCNNCGRPASERGIWYGSRVLHQGAVCRECAEPCVAEDETPPNWIPVGSPLLSDEMLDE